MQSHHIIIRFTAILITFFPVQASTQDKNWIPIQSIAIVKQENQSASAVLASQSPGITKQSTSTNVACDPLTLSSLILAMNKDIDILLFNISRPCDKPITDAFFFTYKPFDGVEGYDGFIKRGSVKYVLLEGQMMIELLSPSFPLKYKITFEARFATAVNRDLHVSGMELAAEDIRSEQGTVIIEPDAQCSSKRTGYAFDSRTQQTPHPAHGRFCFPLFGLSTPTPPKPYPIKTLSP